MTPDGAKAGKGRKPKVQQATPCALSGCLKPATHSIQIKALGYFDICCEHAQDRIMSAEGLITRLTDKLLPEAM